MSVTDSERLKPDMCRVGDMKTFCYSGIPVAGPVTLKDHPPGDHLVRDHWRVYCRLALPLRTRLALAVIYK